MVNTLTIISQYKDLNYDLLSYKLLFSQEKNFKIWLFS